MGAYVGGIPVLDRFDATTLELRELLVSHEPL